MKHVSLSEQLEDHLAAHEEYKLMKQVERETATELLCQVREAVKMVWKAEGGDESRPLAYYDGVLDAIAAIDRIATKNGVEIE